MATYSDVDRLDACKVYAATFAGRTDCYAAWGGSHWITACAPGCPLCRWKAAHRGDDAATPPSLLVHDRAPLTPDVVLRAFQSKSPVSGYILAADSTTHLACLDVDLEDGLMLADTVARVMANAGAPAYIEPSRRGGHLWCVLDRPISGIAIRRALRAFLQAAGAPDDPKIELRPGQDRLQGPDSVGNALRMPLMPHQATGERGALLAPGGRIVARTVYEATLEIEWAPAGVFAEWAEKWAPPEPDLPPAREPGDRPRGIDRFNTDVTVSEVLRVDWGVVNAAPGKSVICPAHDDHNPSLKILADNRRVFCHAPHCDFNNGGRGRDAYDLARLAGTIGKSAA